MANNGPSIEYLTNVLRVCWPLERLKLAAADWPASPTWAWWLGDRLATMSDADALLRVQVALTHAAAQRVPLPMKYGECNSAFKSFHGAQLQAAAAALGAFLDDQTPDAAASMAAAMRGELGAVQSTVIEAAPPDTTTTTTTKKRSK